MIKVKLEFVSSGTATATRCTGLTGCSSTRSSTCRAATPRPPPTSRCSRTTSSRSLTPMEMDTSILQSFLWVYLCIVCNSVLDIRIFYPYMNIQLGQASVNPPDLCLKWWRLRLCRQPCLESWSPPHFKHKSGGVHAGLTQLYSLLLKTHHTKNVDR